MRFYFGIIIAALGAPHLSRLFCPLAATVGFGLIFSALCEKPLKYRFILGALAYGVIHGTAISWLATPFYHGPYIYAVYLILLVLFSAQFGLLCAFVTKERLLKIGSIVTGTALWVLFEWSRHFLLCGYGWNPMGLSLTWASISMQGAALFGVYGLSALVCATNLCFAACFYRDKSALYGFCALASAPYLFGVFHLGLFDRSIQSAPKSHVALVQTGLEIEQKYHMTGREEAFVHPILQWQQPIALLGHRAYDLIVFPECAFPLLADAKMYHPDDVSYLFPHVDVTDYQSNRQLAALLANKHGADVIFGTEHTESGRTYNAAMLVTKEGKSAFYGKRILFPLAESLPYECLRSLAARYGVSDFFSPGLQSSRLEGKHNYGLSVCYEELFGHFVRNKEVDMLVNVTNDGWYHHSKLPLAHYTHAKVRAVESGRPLLRACNTGVTVALDALGREIARLPVENERGNWVRDVLVVDVPVISVPTLYAYLGDYPIILISFLTCFGAILRIKLPKKFRSATVLTTFE